MVSSEGEGVPVPALFFGADFDAANGWSAYAPFSARNRRYIKRAAGIAHCGSPGSKMDCLKNLPQPRYAKLKNTPGPT